jgi:hypothetical protein
MTTTMLSPPLAAYQQNVLARRASSQIDFPAHVHLETLAVCNAACNFCPYPTLDRKGVRMDDALIAKVVDDLADIPRLHPFQLSPFKVNEPFLDVRLFDLLALFNERLPNASLTLTTNASPLTEKSLVQLNGVKNLGYLWVSVNDHREVEYEAAMQLPFKRTLERLQMLHAAKAEGRLTTRVVISRVGDGTADDLAFRAWVSQTWPLFESSIFARGQWIGQVTGAGAAPPDVGCQRWFDISITATGVVAHCCMDGKAEFPIGDVRHEHVLDIYNRLQVKPCRDCGFL